MPITLHLILLILIVISVTYIVICQRQIKQLNNKVNTYSVFIKDNPTGIFCVDFRPPVSTSLPIDEQIDQYIQNSVITEINTIMLKAGGYTFSKEMIGKNLGKIRNVKIEFLKQSARNFIENNYRFSNHTSKIPLQDGSIAWVRRSAFGEIKNNRLIRSWSIVEFITKEKEQQEELEQYRTRLEQIVEDRTQELTHEIEVRKKTEKDLIEAKEAAEAANVAKSEFLANMSHELRTPMNAIIGFTDILIEQIREDKFRRYLDRIQKSGKALLSLINNVLDLSKIEADKIVIQQTPLHTSRFFEEIWEIFSHKIMEKNLEMEIVIDPELPEVILLDEVRFRQILLNLVGNAVKFTHSGSIRLNCRAEYPKGESSSCLDLKVSVTDTGIGIPRDKLNIIFDAFEQQNEQIASRYEGTGLGLTISLRLTEAMGGTLTVESEEKKGSTFTLTIRDVEVASTNGYVSEESNGFHAEVVRFENPTVLIVDDIEYNRDLLRAYLEPSGCRILEAKNGKEAIATAGQSHPDLILLDMKMPVMDGYEASGQMKSDPDLQTIPLIAITASALVQDQNKILQTCDAYLRKPVLRKELFRTMMKYLSHSFADQPETQTNRKIAKTELTRRSAKLPAELVKKIIYAATMAKIDQLQVLTQKVEKSDPLLAAEINGFIEQYDYDGLIKVIKG
jgi:signal transduction histidine kinase/CheY-like chemotaxis protein